MPTLFYDLETSGFGDKRTPLSHPNQPRIVQLGVVLDDDNQKELMRLDVIIRHPEAPQCVIDSWRGAEKVHGISPEKAMLVGVDETTAIDLFLDLIDAADTIVGQNIKGFDNDIVTGTVRRLHQAENIDPFVDKQIFDTMLAAQPVCKIPGSRGGYKKPNLTEIHKFFFNGQAFDGAHQAISDVLAARRCYYELQKLAQQAKERLK
jgi:DNA polymerase III epsilon subunit-like protein